MWSCGGYCPPPGGVGGVFIRLVWSNGDVATRCTVSSTLNISDEMLVTTVKAEMRVLMSV